MLVVNELLPITQNNNASFNYTLTLMIQFSIRIIGWAGAFMDKRPLLGFFTFLVGVSDLVFFFMVGFSFDLINAALDFVTSALAVRQYTMILELEK